ncbi:MAG: Ribonuclease P protein component [Phycisphaerae bacterium]|nr:Ribonuclease P protein component [Phycisphaerae bacterium]
MLLVVKNNYRFPRKFRLIRQTDFSRIYQQRCRQQGQLATIYIAANGLEQCRLGLSVGRRLGGAVVRNRHRRLIREAFRLLRAAQQFPGFDVIVIPHSTQPPTRVEYQDVLQEFLPRLIAKWYRLHPRTEP